MHKAWRGYKGYFLIFSLFFGEGWGEVD